MANNTHLVRQLRQQLEKANAVVSHYEMLIEHLKDQISCQTSHRTAWPGLLPYAPFFRGPTGEALVAKSGELESLLEALEQETESALSASQREILLQIHRAHRHCRVLLELLQMPNVARASLQRGGWNLTPLLERYLPAGVTLEAERRIRFFGNREVVRRTLMALVEIGLDIDARDSPAPHVRVTESASRETATVTIFFASPGVRLPKNEAFYWLPPRMVEEADKANLLPFMTLLFAIQGLGDQNAGVRISRSEEGIEELQIIFPQQEYPEEPPEPQGKARIVILSCPENRRQTQFVQEALSAVGRRVIMLTPAEWQARDRTAFGDVLLMPLPPTCCHNLHLIGELLDNRQPGENPPQLVAIAAVDLPGQREKCLELGATAYFLQPLTPPVLNRFLDGVDSTQQSN